MTPTPQRSTNVTVADNSASTAGGGIYSNLFIPVNLLHVTIIGNDAPSGGGGISGDASAFHLRSAVVAGNTSSGGGPNCTSGFAPIGDGRNVGDSTCEITLPSDAQTLGAQPGAFGGTPVPVAEPLDGSPAVNRAVGACPPTDARGVARPQGPACDAGPAEKQVPSLPDTVAPVGQTLKGLPRDAAGNVGKAFRATFRIVKR